MSQVTIASIDIPNHLRAAQKSRVKALADSIASQGLLQPVGVTPNPDAPERFLLEYGRDRLEACKRLKHEAIGARLLAVNSEQHNVATRARISLRRFTAGERAIACLAWQRRHDKARCPTGITGVPAEAAGISASTPKIGTKTDFSVKAFADHAAMQTGISARTILRYIRAGKNVNRELLSFIAEDNLIRLWNIELIGRLDSRSQQVTVELVRNGTSVRETIYEMVFVPMFGCPSREGSNDVSQVLPAA